MPFREFYNKTAGRRQIRTIYIWLVVTGSIVTGCGAPKAVAIREVCLEPKGSAVSVHGFISLPKSVDVVQLSRGGRVVDVGYRVLLADERSGTGDSVKMTLWATKDKENNRMDAIADVGRFGDLTAYSDDGRVFGIGNSVKITGTVEPDPVGDCVVNVTTVDLSDKNGSSSVTARQ